MICVWFTIDGCATHASGDEIHTERESLTSLTHSCRPYLTSPRATQCVVEDDEQSRKGVHEERVQVRSRDTATRRHRDTERRAHTHKHTDETETVRARYHAERRDKRQGKYKQGADEKNIMRPGMAIVMPIMNTTMPNAHESFSSRVQRFGLRQRQQRMSGRR
jgi:hypothetical protein